jgi:hypothetical protein
MRAIELGLDPRDPDTPDRLMRTSLEPLLGADFWDDQDGPHPYEAPADDDGPIVNDQPKVGRNDPCPCGSGKKYKKCCMPKM